MVLLIVDLFWYLCFVFVFVILSCSLVITCQESADLLALLCAIFSYVFVISHMILDYIDS